MTSLKRFSVVFAIGAFLTASAGLVAQTKEVSRFDPEPVVTGLPYSGEGITTVKLTMFDGTKMERTVTAKLYRDSSGRTRREQIVVGLEALDPNNDFRAVVHIVDHVAGVFYTLNPGSRTAERMPLTMLQGGVTPLRAPLEYAKNVVGLGVKDIDGRSAKGSRTITTIPTDQVGNDKPIDIIDERWESTELRVLLRSLHRDPRSGEIEYALTKISRTEPAASLFQVPSGYTIRDTPIR